MTAFRWQQIEELYPLSWNDNAGRAEFLAEARRADADLQNEVGKAPRS